MSNAMDHLMEMAEQAAQPSPAAPAPAAQPQAQGGIYLSKSTLGLLAFLLVGGGGGAGVMGYLKESKPDDKPAALSDLSEHRVKTLEEFRTSSEKREALRDARMEWLIRQSLRVADRLKIKTDGDPPPRGE